MRTTQGLWCRCFFVIVVVGDDGTGRHGRLRRGSEEHPGERAGVCRSQLRRLSSSVLIRFRAPLSLCLSSETTFLLARSAAVGRPALRRFRRAVTLRLWQKGKSPRCSLSVAAFVVIVVSVLPFVHPADPLGALEDSFSSLQFFIWSFLAAPRKH